MSPSVLEEKVVGPTVLSVLKPNQESNDAGGSSTDVDAGDREPVQPQNGYLDRFLTTAATLREVMQDLQDRKFYETLPCSCTDQL